MEVELFWLFFGWCLINTLMSVYLHNIEVSDLKSRVNSMEKRLNYLEQLVRRGYR